MPNRMIREGWLDSTAISRLSAEAERFFLRLFLAADDAGRFDGRAEILKARCFPLIIGIGEPLVQEWLAKCHQAGLLVRYGWGGNEFIQIMKFQRVGAAGYSKFPWRDGSHKITYTKRETRDGQKEFVTTSLPDGVGRGSGGGGDGVSRGSGGGAGGVRRYPETSPGTETETCTETETKTGMGTDVLGSDGTGQETASPPPDSGKGEEQPNQDQRIEPEPGNGGVEKPGVMEGDARIEEKALPVRLERSQWKPFFDHFQDRIRAKKGIAGYELSKKHRGVLARLYDVFTPELVMALWDLFWLRDRAWSEFAGSRGHSLEVFASDSMIQQLLDAPDKKSRAKDHAVRLGTDNEALAAES